MVLRIDINRPIDSWARLSELLDEWSKRRCIFRGVKRASYALIPKIGRPESRKEPQDGSSLPFSEGDEERMFEEFKRQARPYFRQEPQNDFEAPAIAQHHGLPTRLLDWTESLLVAAYFAAEAAGTDPEPPAIYAVDLDDNKDFLELVAAEKNEQSPFEIHSELAVYWPPHLSPRIAAQRAVLTVHKQPDRQLSLSRIEKWTLEKGRPSFRLKLLLDKCGINRASLFPDIDGLAEYTGWRYKWGRLN